MTNLIRIYESDCKDFSKNGLGPLAPSSCTVSETLNGTWELTLEHPLDDAGKWQRLQEERIIVAPVPAAPTPRVGLVHQDNIGHYYRNEIYSINTKRDPLRLRSGPGFDYAIIDHIDIGMEVIVTDTVTDEDGGEWCEVIGPYGEHGFQYKSYLKKERTEEGATSSGSVYATGTVVESRLLRDQPFRIYRVVPSDADSAKVTVYARHIFYDLMDNMIQQYRPVPDEAGATVAESLLTKCLSAHGFRMYSDLITTASDVDLSNLNPVSAMLEDGGMTANYAAELARDWYDVFMVKRVGYDKDVTIRRGKNLKGITYDADITNVVTRIMPTGEDRNGNVLYLPEVYIASPRESEYVHPKWYRLEVADAAESDATDDEAAVTKEDVYQKLREAAQKEFDNGCDLATLTLTVDFVNCADTEEYKQYRFLQNIYIGDSVRVINSRIGVDTRIRMTDYTFNCLTLQYDAMTLGTLASTPDNSLITGKQLGNGIVTGNKIALSSVSTGKLVNGSVVAEKIATHTITVDQIASSVGSNLDISSNRTITLQAQKMEGVFKSIGADGYEKTGIVNIGVNGIGVQHSDIASNTVLDATGMKVYNSAGQVIGGVYAPVANQSAQLVASTMLNPETPEYCAQFKKYAGDHGLTDVYGFELMRTSDGLPLVGLTANADGTEGYLSSRSHAVAISSIVYACSNVHPVVVSASDPGVGNYPEGTLWLKPLGE
nr:MAG TPA: tail protein [Caudoviricetes sp.]